jgi:HK97 family phage prohead protease
MTEPKDLLQRLRGTPEHRSAEFDFEMRATSKGDDMHFTGYAARFDSPAQVGRGPAGPFTEWLETGAFDTTLRSKPDVVLRTEHRNLPMARTSAGNMRLSVDSKGLIVDATLDRRDPDVRALEVKMENRNLSQMSYVFRAVRDKWNDDYTERHLQEVSLDKGDVSVVTFGANENTSSRMGSLAEVKEVLASLDFEDALTEARSLDDPLHDLREVRSTLDRLLTELTPKDSRRLSLADAVRVIEGRD